MRRSLKDHLDPAQGPKRILSLDGGGVKGILTLGLLEAIEGELRRRSRNPALVLSDYYDLIGGTSTGAIIGSGLALGNSVQTMIELYMQLGPEVFGRSVGDGLLLQSKFDTKKLRKALEGALGRRTLGSPDLRTGFANCAKRIDTGSAWVLTNHPRSKFYNGSPDGDVRPNRRYRLIDIVQASAAAPTFFDEVKINILEAADDGSTVDGEIGYFVDGAVSGANNPSITLLMVALVHEYGFGWKPGVGSLMMTSCGTGMRRPRVSGASFRGHPPGWRGIQALRSMIYDTQVQGVMLLQALSDPQRPWFVNSELGAMTESMITDQYLLDYQRLDVRLETPSSDDPNRAAKLFAEDALGRALTDKELADMDQLSNGKPANMERLLEVGRAAAARIVGPSYPNPYFDLPEWA
jgi:hypothetical protein